mgnify:CR=1 FL=1
MTLDVEADVRDKAKVYWEGNRSKKNIKKDNLSEVEDENEDDFDAPRKRLELIFSHITEEEKEILEKYDFKYEYTEDNKIKLIDEDCAIYYTIEIDDEDKGIYLEETKTYYNYFKYDFISRENERTKNLVISKEGVRVEIIFNERR